MSRLDSLLIAPHCPSMDEYKNTAA